MAASLSGRRQELRVRYALMGNGLELAVVPGTDPSRDPADLPLPATGLPVRLAHRVILLRFVAPAGVEALTAANVVVTGASTRWVVVPSRIPTLAAADSALQPADMAWLAAFQTAVEQAPGLADSWLIVHTEAAVPATVAVQVEDGAGAPLAGLEPRLASLSVDQDATFTVAVSATWLNGISHLHVVDQHPVVSERLRQRVVLVCLENAFGMADLRAGHVTIDGGVRVPSVAVRWVWPLATIERVVDPELTSAERTGLRRLAAARSGSGELSRWLAVCTEERGDFSTYTVRIDRLPLFDPLLSAATALFKIDCASAFDCETDEACLAAQTAAPPLDYLTRDFAGFQRLLLDRLAALGAADADQNPVGLWSVLTDLIAARADQLAYAQDAVATEAYLHTARKRSSVRRHARLLDYRMHEGVNARTWVHIAAAPGVDLPLPVRESDLLATRLSGAPPVLPPSVLDAPLPPETEVFHVVLPMPRLLTAHNEIRVYAWGEDDLCLARGTTRCTLHDPGQALQFHAGDVVSFESVASATTGRAEDADPALRHVARLVSEPVPGTDHLLGQTVLEIAWRDEDALPFDLPVRQRGRDLAFARGNLLLAAHGRPVHETVGGRPWGSRGRLHARLTALGLTWSEPAPAWTDSWAASVVVRQGTDTALPKLTLLDADGTVWRPQRDLLASDRSATEFWVEMESDGQAWIRFGDDTTGRSPIADATFTATYWTGNGATGNVGARAVAHLLTTALDPAAVAAVYNPLPATGGLDPEALPAVRSAAPYAFRRQERAVTLDDWADVAARDPGVQRAVATLRWTGSWHTVRVHVDRVEGRAADPSFVDETTARLDRYRLAGYDLEVVGPTHVPLDIALTVCAAPDAWPEAVAEALAAAFGTGVLVDGARGFFHPDNYTFGDGVFLSQIVARAMAVPGVRWVDTRQGGRNRFRRWSSTATDRFDDGVLRMGDLEIARCDSNASAPERGRIVFHVEGGA